MRFFKVVGTVG